MQFRRTYSVESCLPRPAMAAGRYGRFDSELLKIGPRACLPAGVAIKHCDPHGSDPGEVQAVAARGLDPTRWWGRLFHPGRPQT